MHTVVLRLKCKDAEIVKKSLEPDIKNDEYSKTKLKTGKDFLEVSIESKKLNHLKAIINSYIDFVYMFENAKVE